MSKIDEGTLQESVITTQSVNAIGVVPKDKEDGYRLQEVSAIRNVSISASKEIGAAIDNSIVGSNTSMASFVSAKDTTECETDINNVASLTEKQIHRSFHDIDKMSLKDAVKEAMLEVKEEWNKEFKQTIESSIAKLQTEWKDGLIELKNKKKEIDTSIAAMEKSHEDLKTELNTTKEQLNGCKIQVSELISIVSRQDQIIQECQNHIEDLRIDKGDKNLIIQGLTIPKSVSCKEVVKAFFNDKLKMGEDSVPIHSAFKRANRLLK